MDIVKVTINGQVTIPVQIRKRLGIKPGDKVVFIENGNGNTVTLANSSLLAIEKFQNALSGKAEDAGFATEEDVAGYLKDIRQELYQEKHKCTD
ncbi:MAG: AbrB/MazE/SpoVT family DNA-binding domain-containing protein [Clostridiales Family XIII bacterium]|jgi:AbrB family looped-hinge helix DNA binding protein|nr:AbrB/MazE/SpoVT family DNA-binding domain-containing protein [Clostridiales Family XIII bacterium]